MNVIPTALPGVLIIEPKVFGDARGFFFESFNQRAFNEATGTDHDFVQDNHSRSAHGVLRGLHYQVQQPQGQGLPAPAFQHFHQGGRYLRRFGIEGEFAEDFLHQGLNAEQ